MSRHSIFANPAALIACACLPICGGCITTAPPPTAAQHQASLGSTQEAKLTLGVVQSRIKEGMTQEEVIIALGSPNMVTQDAAGNDTYIYDKISTESSYSESARGSSVGGGVGGGAINIAGDVIGGALGGISGSRASRDQSGARAQSQRTLTVVIKFDENRLVTSVRSQSSSF